MRKRIYLGLIVLAILLLAAVGFVVRGPSASLRTVGAS
jgi:hypothetical protein